LKHPDPGFALVAVPAAAPFALVGVLIKAFNAFFSPLLVFLSNAFAGVLHLQIQLIEVLLVKNRILYTC
jgi:hypothetical protein